MPAGNVAVIDCLGYVSDDYRDSGIQFVLPWCSAVKFSTKTQIVTMSEDVPSKEGLLFLLGKGGAVLRKE